MTCGRRAEQQLRMMPVSVPFKFYRMIPEGESLRPQRKDEMHKSRSLPHLNLKKCVLLRSPTCQDGTPLHVHLKSTCFTEVTKPRAHTTSTKHS